MVQPQEAAGKKNEAPMVGMVPPRRVERVMSPPQVRWMAGRVQMRTAPRLVEMAVSPAVEAEMTRPQEAAPAFPPLVALEMSPARVVEEEPGFQ